jgi:cytochrome b561
MLRNTTETYGLVSRALHWLLAVLILGMVILGLVVEEMPKGPQRSGLMNWHQSLGTLVLILVAVRLAWRLVGPVPAPLGSAGTQRLATLMHWLLYGLMILQPLSGLVQVQAAGHDLLLFGAWPVPRLVGENAGLKEFLEEVHETGWIALAVAVAGHAAAALKHHLIDRDRTLARMWRG